MRFDEAGNLVLEKQWEVQALTTNCSELPTGAQAYLNEALHAQGAVVPIRSTLLGRFSVCMLRDQAPEELVAHHPTFVITPELTAVSSKAVEATLTQPFYKISRRRRAKINRAAQEIADILETPSK